MTFCYHSKCPKELQKPRPSQHRSPCPTARPSFLRCAAQKSRSSVSTVSRKSLTSLLFRFWRREYGGCGMYQPGERKRDTLLLDQLVQRRDTIRPRSAAGRGSDSGIRRTAARHRSSLSVRLRTLRPLWSQELWRLVNSLSSWEVNRTDGWNCKKLALFLPKERDYDLQLSLSHFSENSVLVKSDLQQTYITIPNHKEFKFR